MKVSLSDIVLVEGNNELNVALTPIEAPPGITFSVEVYNIPDYASESYQWFITYGGKTHGMVDPQAGIWTPIDSPIVVENVPPSGGLQATLMAGPYKSWSFIAARLFEKGKEYMFDLTAGIIASGIALTNLIVEPKELILGESVTISVTVINTEETSQEYSVNFDINGEITKVLVTLEPKESKEASIEVTPADPGNYRVKVDELFYEDFTVYPAPPPPPPGGVGTWRNVSWEWETYKGKIQYYKAVEVRGEIYFPLSELLENPNCNPLLDYDVEAYWDEGFGPQLHIVAFPNNLLLGTAEQFASGWIPVTFRFYLPRALVSPGRFVSAAFYCKPNLWAAYPPSYTPTHIVKTWARVKVIEVKR